MRRCCWTCVRIWSGRYSPRGSGTDPVPCHCPTTCAALVKAVPLRLTAPFAIERAISSAGGLAWDEVETTLMLRRRPGTFACGEMLDWEAPTGGYLLQACFATGHAAGQAAAAFVR